MRILHETAGLTILFDPTNCWLSVTWRGIHSGQSVQDCCKLILAHVRSTGSRKLLNDGSQDLDGWQEVVRWTAEDFFPLLADNGVTAIAWVKPNDLHAQTLMNQTIKATKRPVVDVFADVESAYQWLKWTAPVNQVVY